MNYNDFPILTNDEYNLINEHYSSTKECDRNSILEEICSLISTCLNYSLSPSNKYNSTILNSIQQSNLILNKICNNLTSIFNLRLKPNLNYYNLNIFSYMKHLIEISRQFLNWIKNENKEYYKSIAIKNNKEIYSAFENILSSTDESNIVFFKHM